MSGEGGGILIGGLVLVAALPVVLAGAAMVGAAVGLGALGRAAIHAGIEHHRKTKLELDNVSAELGQMYGKLRSTVEAQRRLSEEYDRKIAREFTAASERMNQAVERGMDRSKMDRMLQDTRSSVNTQIQETRNRELTQFRENAKREAAAQISALEQAQKMKLSLNCWKQQTAAAKANQKAIAASLLRDAKSTIVLLRSLSASSTDPAYVQQVQVYEDSHRGLEQAMQAGAYQSVAASAQNIITNGARLAMEYELSESEKDEIRVALVMRLTELDAEFDSTAKVQLNVGFCDGQEEYLDDFIQGRYSEVQEEIRALLQEIRSEEGQRYSLQKLQLLQAEVEDSLVPKAYSLRDEAYANLISYYERLRALEIISDYMKDQGYQVDWAQTAGNDASQKLVVHFTQPVNGNSVSVALDRDATTTDIDRMAMEVMFYYGNNNQVSELEKERLRQRMLAALKRERLGGNLSCTGNVDQQASDKTLHDQAAVRSMPVRRQN